VANLDFYGLDDDLRNIVRFLLEDTDVVIYELASAPDAEVRRFRSLSELQDVAGRFQLWSPSVMAAPTIRRVGLTGVPGRSYRYAVEGAGLLQLYLDGLRDDVIVHSHYGHWSEAGARRRSVHDASACDWSALGKLSGRIQRFIRGQAAARLHARPILPDASRAVRQGAGLRFGPDVHRADSTAIAWGRARRGRGP
jgi:hypothetical protein